MNCSICNEKIVLSPSAKKRAAKYGDKPSDYTRLFTTHTWCQIDARNRAAYELIKERRVSDEMVQRRCKW